MRNETIDLYIRSVTRSLPKPMRADVATELDGLIEDMLGKRCGDVQPSDRDIKVVLAELGEPYELACQYAPLPRGLIGPSLFPAFRLVVIIVSASVVFGVTLGKIIEAFKGASQWYMVLGTWAVGLIQGLLIAFGVVTLVFAILDRVTTVHQTRTQEAL